MNILIYGSGAIGIHLAYCLDLPKNNIYLFTGKNSYDKLKKKGIRLDIYNNKNLVKKYKKREGKNFKIINDFKNLQKTRIDLVIITLKLYDFKSTLMREIYKNINNDFNLILPCTSLPAWWIKKYNKKFKNTSHNFKKDQKFIGITMWLSAYLKEKGYSVVRHVQRGYPVKEINKSSKSTANYLRACINKKCISPKVSNIYFETYMKSINSLAFNMIALLYKKSNKEILNNSNCVNDIFHILKEGDQLIKNLNIPINQSIQSRINQTLSSSEHTMSMLTDYRNKKKVEISFIWNSFTSIFNKKNKMKTAKKKFLLLKNKIKIQDR